METKTIKQSVTFKASPHDVSRGADRRQKTRGIYRREGNHQPESRLGKFNVFDGYATGITKSWSRTKKSCRPGRRTTGRRGIILEVTFAFAKADGGTKMTFTPTGVPEDPV